jgi:hypothetical protein
MGSQSGPPPVIPSAVAREARENLLDYRQSVNSHQAIRRPSSMIPKVHKLRRHLIIFAVTTLFALGCRSTGSRVDSLIEQGLYEQALAVLEEEGAGVTPTAKVEEEALEARAQYEEAVSDHFVAEATDLEQQGKLRGALEVADRGTALCPWSIALSERHASLASTVTELDRLEKEWGEFGSSLWPATPERARELLRDFRPLAPLLEDSPDLMRVHCAARDVVIRDWTLQLKGSGGVLTREQAVSMQDELQDCPEIGEAAQHFLRLVTRFSKLHDSAPRTEADVESVLHDAQMLALDLRSRSEHGDQNSPLRPCQEVLTRGLEEWALRQLPQMLDSPLVNFASISDGEQLAENLGNNEALHEVVALGHLRRAEVLGRGGVPSLLAWMHLERAAELGMSRADPRIAAAETKIGAALAAAEWPVVAIGIDVGPEINPALQSIVGWGLKQEILARSGGWSRWRWVEPRLETPDVLLTITKAEYANTTLADLKEIRSSYFSHFQTVPNPAKASLKMQLDLSEISVDSALSSYNSAVSSHNIYPTTWSMNTVNSRYNTYVSRLNSHNVLVATYNATSSTTTKEIYLPYSFHEGTVTFGWQMDVQISVGEQTETSRASSTVSDYARIGTRRADRAVGRRSDDPISIDTSVEASFEHLQAVAASACKELDPMLEGLSHDSFIQLAAPETRALSRLLHPWGLKSSGQASSELPGWLVSVAEKFDLEPSFRSPLATHLPPLSDQPPSHATVGAMADWYAPILCEVRASDKDRFLGHGSGVLISGDGLVLTCAHVLIGPLLTIQIHEGDWSGEYDLEPVFVNEADKPSKGPTSTSIPIRRTG